MTMPSSGALNMGGTSSPVSVNFELGRASPYQQTVSMNDSVVRSLAGVSGTSGSTWSMSSLYGKSAITISLAGFYSISGTVYSGPGPAYAEITLYSNGVAGWAGSDGSGSFTNWATPTTGGVGSSYWVRFTQTSSVSGTNETGSARNTWVALSGSPYFGVQRTLGGYGSRTYTIQIASDSGGSNIVATVTSIEIAAEIAF